MTREDPMRAALVAILVGAGACGGAAAGTAASPASPEEAPGAEGEERRDSGPPAFRARVWVGGGGADAPDNWTDIEVSGVDERAEAICQAVAEAQTRLPPDVEMEIRRARPCQPTPLPRVVHPDADALLVDRRELSNLDLLIVAPDAAGEAPPGERVSTTYYTAYGSSAECDRMRAELMARIEEARAEARAAAQRWLEEQRVAQSERIERECAAADAREAECARTADDQERALCENIAEVSRHQCDNARMVQEVIEARLAAQESEVVDEGPDPECQPNPARARR